MRCSKCPLLKRLNDYDGSSWLCTRYRVQVNTNSNGFQDYQVKSWCEPGIYHHRALDERIDYIIKFGDIYEQKTVN